MVWKYCIYFLSNSQAFMKSLYDSFKVTITIIFVLFAGIYMISKHMLSPSVHMYVSIVQVLWSFIYIFKFFDSSNSLSAFSFDKNMLAY